MEELRDNMVFFTDVDHRRIDFVVWEGKSYARGDKRKKYGVKK